MEHILFLANIRSVENVASLFRTAECAGIVHVVCGGITPSPKDRFGRLRKDFIKVSLGTEERLRWKEEKDIVRALQAFKKTHHLLGIEQDKNAKDYKNIVLEKPTVFILGEERHGLPLEYRKEIDEFAEIPMKGEKESLNVAVAGGIALFRVLGI